MTPIGAQRKDPKLTMQYSSLGTTQKVLLSKISGDRLGAKMDTLGSRLTLERVQVDRVGYLVMLNIR